MWTVLGAKVYNKLGFNFFNVWRDEKQLLSTAGVEGEVATWQVQFLAGETLSFSSDSASAILSFIVTAAGTGKILGP